MSSAPSAPCRLHNDGSVFRAREGAGQDLFAAPQVFALHISPLANPKKRVRAAAGVRAGEKRTRLRSLVFVEAHAKLAGVRSAHNESRFEFVVERVVCQGNDIAKFLPGVLLRARRELRIPDEFQVEAMAAVGRPGPKEILTEKLRTRESPNDRRKISESVFEGPFRRI
jgi:hypothetical protein